MANVFNQTIYLLNSQNARELEKGISSYQTLLLSISVQRKVEGGTFFGGGMELFCLFFVCLTSFPRLGFHIYVKLESRELKAIVKLRAI